MLWKDFGISAKEQGHIPRARLRGLPIRNGMAEAKGMAAATARTTPENFILAEWFFFFWVEV
jgi:hypothetical protein